MADRLKLRRPAALFVGSTAQLPGTGTAAMNNLRSSYKKTGTTYCRDRREEASQVTLQGKDISGRGNEEVLGKSQLPALEDGSEPVPLGCVEGA